MKRNLLKKAYVSIEVIIVAAVIITAGLSGVLAFVKNGKNNNKTMLNAIDDVYTELEMPLGGGTGGSGNGGDLGDLGGIENEEALIHDEIVDGAYYWNSGGRNENFKRIVTTTYDSMPTTISNGDYYLYGDYLYGYFDGGWCVSLATSELYEDYADGELDFITNFKWTDRNQKSYGTILNSINDGDIKVLEATFNNCASLEIAPTIPNSVTNINVAFDGCSSLEITPVIPDSVTNMWHTFSNCTSLKTIQNFPNGITDLEYTFSNCPSLVSVPALPDSVTYAWGTFQDCTSLVSAPALPKEVVYAGEMFRGCTSLTTAPIIPSSVIDMCSMFEGCTLLTDAPVIPNGVTDMSGAFNGCTSLTTAPIIPSSVVDMCGAFLGCVSLTGEIEINADIDITDSWCYEDCFKDTVKSIKITGSTTAKAQLAGTANNGNVTY